MDTRTLNEKRKPKNIGELQRKLSLAERVERPWNVLSKEAASAVWRFLSSCFYQMDHVSDSRDKNILFARDVQTISLNPLKESKRYGWNTNLVRQKGKVTHMKFVAQAQGFWKKSKQESRGNKLQFTVIK